MVNVEVCNALQPEHFLPDPDRLHTKAVVTVRQNGHLISTVDLPNLDL